MNICQGASQGTRTHLLPEPDPLLSPFPLNKLLLPAEGFVIDPRMLLSCGVGAARIVEVSEKRETVMNVEVFMLRACNVRQAKLLRSGEMEW